MFFPSFQKNLLFQASILVSLFTSYFCLITFLHNCLCFSFPLNALSPYPTIFVSEIWGVLPRPGNDTSSKKCLVISSFLFFFFKISYLFMRDTHRERQRHRQGEKQSPCGEPDVGFHLKIPGSWPEPKADPQPLNYPGVTKFWSWSQHYI